LCFSGNKRRGKFISAKLHINQGPVILTYQYFSTPFVFSWQKLEIIQCDRIKRSAGGVKLQELKAGF
jgi:hypothetical protein